MTKVPPEVAQLLAELAHPNRLPILIALEERPRAASELAADLDLDLNAVHWALKKLRAAGMVVVQERGVTTNNLTFGINATPHRKWKGVLRAVAAVAATKNEPKTKAQRRRKKA